MSTPPQRWRPPSFLEMFRRLADELKVSQAMRATLDSHAKELDLGMRVAFDGLYNLDEGRAVESGKRVVWGTETVTGSKTAIDTGLAAVENVVASIRTSTATNEWVTATFNKGLISLYVWQPTTDNGGGTANVTPIASVTAQQICWQAAGT